MLHPLSGCPTVHGNHTYGARRCAGAVSHVIEPRHASVVGSTLVRYNGDGSSVGLESETQTGKRSSARIRRSTTCRWCRRRLLRPSTSAEGKSLDDCWVTERSVVWRHTTQDKQGSSPESSSRGDRRTVGGETQDLRQRAVRRIRGRAGSTQLAISSPRRAMNPSRCVHFA
jgi:hypothetical protein